MGRRAKRRQAALSEEMFAATQAQLERYNEEQAVQRELLEEQKDKYRQFEFKNPYADMENVYEDQTVDLKAAEFAKEQSQQSLSNIMASMKGAAGGSGVAGLAQVLANQGVKQAQQASADIGRQEQANQARARAEAGRLQQLDREGEQRRDLLEREGRRQVEQFDLQKQDKMLEMAMNRKAAADQAIANANAQLDSFVSGAVTSGLGALTGGAGSGLLGGVKDLFGTGTE